jgi:hypothetical protein
MSKLFSTKGKQKTRSALSGVNEHGIKGVRERLKKKER